MSERDRAIIELAKSGLSARKIKERLNLDIDVRTIQNVTKRALGPRPTNKNSVQYQIPPVIMPHIKECLRRLGKDPFLCEICGDPQTKKCDIHHTKYEGATVYDLQYVCRSCNLAFMNKGLA